MWKFIRGITAARGLMIESAHNPIRIQLLGRVAPSLYAYLFDLKRR